MIMFEIFLGKYGSHHPHQCRNQCIDTAETIQGKMQSKACKLFD